MAETHELRLKINAAAARAGAREFVAAINSIKKAVRDLDRDSSGAFTRLKKNLADASRGSRVKLNIVDRTALRNLESYSRLASQAIRSTANTSRSASNLASQMQSLSSSYATARGQSDALTASVTRLNTALGRQASLSGAAAAAASRAGAGGSPAAVAPRGGGGASSAVADQERIQRAVETTRLSVERLTTQFMKIGGFQNINELGRAFRDFQRQASSGAQSASDFARAQNTMRSAITGAQTSLTTLSAKQRDSARAAREASAASTERGRAALMAAGNMRTAEQAVAALTNRLRAVGDTTGIATLNQALIRLRSNMAGGIGTTNQMRTAMSQFADTTSKLKVNLAAVEGSQTRAANSSRNMARAQADASSAIRRLERDMRSAASAANAANNSFRSATGGMRGLENAFSGGFQAASLFRTALGSITIGTFTKSVFEAGDALQQFNITMEVASGSAQAAAGDLDFINSIAAKLGTNLSASREAFSKFAVSSDIAGVSGEQTRMIFESVSTAMAVLGRGTEDQKLAFLALEQMMSKGVISAEELRRQLGERLPGAVSLMAKSVGVSVAELQKMLKAGELISSEVLPKFAAELDKTFGSQLDRTFNRAGANLGRLQNSFTLLLEIMANSGFLDELSIQFRDLAGLLNSNESKEAAKAIGKGLADAARIGGDAIQWLIQNIEMVGTVAKNVIGGIVIAQFARMAGAIATGGQQMLIAVSAFRGLGAGAQVASAQMVQAGAAAGLTAKQVTTMQAAMTGATVAGGRLGATLGLAGRALGFLGGPLGIAVSALAFAPMLFNAFAGSVEDAAADYTGAIRDMESSTFRFFDRVRDATEQSPAEAILNQVEEMKNAQALLASLREDENAQITTRGAFSAITSDSGLADSVRRDIQAIRDLNTELMNPETSMKRLVEVTDEMKEKMLEVRASIPEAEARRLEDALLPAAQIIRQIAATQKELDSTSGGQVEAIIETNAALEVSLNTVRALREGYADIGSVEINPKIRELLESTSASNLTDSIAELERALSTIPTVTDGLLDDFGTLVGQFQTGEITAAQFSTRMAELKPRIEAAVAPVQGMTGGLSEMADRAIQAADDSIVLSDALEEAEAAADAARAAANGAAGGFGAAGNAAAAAATQINGYAKALADAQGINAAIATTANDFVADAELRVKIEGMEGVDKAIAQDLNFGRTSRAVADVDAQISNLRTTIDTAKSSFGDVPVGIVSDLTGELATAEANRARIIAAGEAATRAAESNRGSGRKGGGGGSRSKEELTALQELMEARDEYLLSIQAENQANKILASGLTKSKEAADMLGEAFANGVVMTDEQTMAFIAQIEAAERLNKALTEMANDPVNDWMNNVASWREAGQAIETQVFESLGDQISKFIQTGKFSFEELGASILSTAADIISDMAVKELTAMLGGNISGQGEGGFGLGGILSGMFGNSSIGQPEGDPLAAGFDGKAAGQAISQAMINGGQQAAAAIQQAMSTASGQLSAGVASGGASAGTAINSSVTTAGTSAGTAMNTSIVTGGTTAATAMGTAVSAGSAGGAPFFQTAIEQGSQTGGGFFSQIFSGLFGGGGGGGGLGGLFGMILPALFGSGGGVTGGGGPAIPSVMAPATAFRQAPKYAMGSPNVTGGVPAILHNNEAVVPLTGGRKIPIEGGGASGGGGQVINQTFNITTPDADSFRKSQSQIAADAASSGQRALSKNR
jgi:tape measure domain-containing protein